MSFVTISVLIPANLCIGSLRSTGRQAPPICQASHRYPFARVLQPLTLPCQSPVRPEVQPKPSRKPVKRASPTQPAARRRAAAAVPAARSANAIGPASAWSAAAASRSGISGLSERRATTSSRCATSSARAPKSGATSFIPRPFVTDDYRRSAVARRCRGRRHHDASARAAAARRGRLARRQARAQPEAVRARPRRGRAAGRPGRRDGRASWPSTRTPAGRPTSVTSARRCAPACWATIDAVHCDVHWDHSWVKGTARSNDVDHLILYDFAIHWFDFLTTLMGEQQPRACLRLDGPLRHAGHHARRCWARRSIEYESRRRRSSSTASRSSSRIDRTLVVGTTARSAASAPRVKSRRVELDTPNGIARPKLKGCWFPDGFHGTMAELLVRDREKREPTHSARNNLASLALCFAAVASAERGKPIVPGTVRRLPGN